MKVVIDPKKCVLCGACEVLTQGAIVSPGDKPAFVNPKTNLKDPKVREDVKTAADTCPQRAIKVT